MMMLGRATLAVAGAKGGRSVRGGGEEEPEKRCCEDDSQSLRSHRIFRLRTGGEGAVGGHAVVAERDGADDQAIAGGSGEVVILRAWAMGED